MTIKKFPVCPNSPNCVSSETVKKDKQHYIAPFKLISDADKTWDALKNCLIKQAQILIIEENRYELKAQVKSRLFRFIDDLNFVLDEEKKLIEVYSASRLGYSDLGVNRRRLETLRKQLQQLNVIE